MKYKMIVSDFDGTLYTDDYKVTEETLSAVRDYREAGGKFFIATGRLFQAIRPHAELFGLTNEVITYQGGGVYDLTTGEMIMSHSVDSKCAARIYEYLYEHYSDVTVPMLFYKDKCIAERACTPVIQFASIVKVTPEYCGMRLDRYVDSNGICPNKLPILTAPEISEQIADDLVSRFGDSVNVNRSNPVLIEMVSKTASKGAAVQWLAEKYGIKREEIICFGDAENDISMLEYAGLGVAMGNSMDRTKDAADMVCATNNENGVAQVIREVALKE